MESKYIETLFDFSQKSNFVGLKGNFSDLPALLEQNNLKRWAESCSAIVVEFGPSPQHLKMGRGLDCTLNEPLDLRMHDDSGLKKKCCLF